jgi:hypothetical protein
MVQSGFRALAMVGAATMALVPCSVAEASRRAPLRFLGGDPMGPLATIRDHHVARPESTACRQWGPVGSRWLDLDALGNVAGEVTVTQRELFDYTGCNELTARRTKGSTGAGVYVNGRAGYHAPGYARWEPDRATLDRLTALTNVHQSTIPSADPTVHVPFSQRALFFQTPDNGARYAVVGGLSLILATLGDDGRWTVLHEATPGDAQVDERGYSVRAVLDMDGDRSPDIVFHFREGAGEWFGDSVLTQTTHAGWAEVSGTFGSTA